MERAKKCVASPFLWLTLFLASLFEWAAAFLGLAYAELKVNFVEGYLC